MCRLIDYTKATSPDQSLIRIHAKFPTTAAVVVALGALPLGFLGDLERSLTMVVQVAVISCVPLFTCVCLECG